ncbi:DUF5752 family protein [Caldisericum exile]|uniref:Uncharacterized protein n=1 Tax=Caldisericum exile (strain DSM 21853 / NBRC 104410 / AZM16c01) TaxID=511051 RepID=A0A7U6JFT6_CALEA|nr:DUF5752 family protein [Caldisericum exile]BAL80794.1 hypothetical protein CSE_06680 [Caldisericum exile AZM16c01]
MGEYFEFLTSSELVFLTGRRAKNLSELLEGIKASSDATIFYHTHRFLIQHQYISPEPPNDFAYWVSNILLDRLVSEKLAAIDLIECKSIREIKEKIIRVIEENMSRNNSRTCPPGMEFHFMYSHIFITNSGKKASNLKEFVEILRVIPIRSVYFHMFQSRLMLGKGENDFSIWLRESLGQKELADEISRIDPYTYTLEGLRNKLIRLVSEYVYG